MSISLLLVLGGCSTAKKRPYQTTGDGLPIEGQAERKSDGTFGPSPVRKTPVVLVFGPGMARGYAHAGVIRELVKKKIPIGAIFGTEMGALIGSMYATSKTINQFDWKLQRFKEKVFLSSSAALAQLFDENQTKKLERNLSRVFGRTNVTQTQIPMRIGIFSENETEHKLVSEGSLSSVVRASMSEPGIFESTQFNDGPARSASTSRPFPIEEAKQLGLGPVVVVDVLSEQEANDNIVNRENYFIKRMSRARELGEDVLNEADLVLRPDLKGVGYFDFKKRTRIVFRGRQAVRKNLSKIRELVGLPNEEESL